MDIIENRPIPPMPERKPHPYNTYDYIAGLLSGNNDRDLIGELSDSITAIAAPASTVPVHDTRLENLEAALADTQKRLVELEKSTKITPSPSPKPKPIPEPKHIPVPDIVSVIVTPVDPTKPAKLDGDDKRRPNKTRQVKGRGK